MKYTIEGFSQKFAMTLKKEVQIGDKTVLRKIDCTDLVILRWFVDFYPNMKKVEVEGKQYAWLTHKKLLDDLPLIDISRKAFVERMQKLVDFDILTYKLVKEGGTFSLYGFGDNYQNLINEGVGVQTDTGCPNESTGGVRSNGYGVGGQTDNKDISIKDTSIKNLSITDKKRKKETTYDEIISALITDEEVKATVYEFIKMRKMIKKPMTDYALKKLLNKLCRLASDPQTQIAILDKSIQNNWQDIYEPKEDSKTAPKAEQPNDKAKLGVIL